MSDDETPAASTDQTRIEAVNSMLGAPALQPVLAAIHGQGVDAYRLSRLVFAIPAALGAECVPCQADALSAVIELGDRERGTALVITAFAVTFALDESVFPPEDALTVVAPAFRLLLTVTRSERDLGQTQRLADEMVAHPLQPLHYVDALTAGLWGLWALLDWSHDP